MVTTTSDIRIAKLLRTADRLMLKAETAHGIGNFKAAIDIGQHGATLYYNATFLLGKRFLRNPSPLENAEFYFSAAKKEKDGMQETASLHF